MSLSLKETYMKYKVCVICNVPQSQAPGVLYAKFPQNVNRCRRWLRVIGDVKLLQLSLKKLQYRFVCGNHFLPHHYTKSGKHLTKDAIPSLFPHTIKPLKKAVVKLFPMPMHRTSDKILLKCSQRIVPITPSLKNNSPNPVYEYLENEFEMHMDPDAPEVSEHLISPKKESLSPALQECLPKIIPILHQNLPPNSQTTEIYTINKDRQVIPITTKVLNDGKECVIEFSQKKIPVVPKQPKVIPVSDKVLSTILKKDVDVKIEPITEHYNTLKPKQNQREEELQRKIVKLQRRNKQLKRILKNIYLVDEVQSPNIRRVIKKAVYNKQLKEGINEFTHEKQMAAAILKRALSAYHYLSCLMPLPSVCALEKIAKGVPVTSKTTKCRHLL
ncbi:uncharacterized protein LOC125225337 isoform X2 [Leguminivora glycinivorella]|uniref:uncharacterized protein LOC125225337 isoform X2 n=1 Tax=Leguminivora glycinivorella TaxID=1035111 RepID=UPI00200F22B0|nr:uncharacterized protein LOC125225337 isoform X2 [Leguminivora glycinivorella]